MPVLSLMEDYYIPGSSICIPLIFTVDSWASNSMLLCTVQQTPLFPITSCTARGRCSATACRCREKRSLKKNLNASGPSEHPPVRGKNVKTFSGWVYRLQRQNLFIVHEAEIFRVRQFVSYQVWMPPCRLQERCVNSMIRRTLLLFFVTTYCRHCFPPQTIGQSTG